MELVGLADAIAKLGAIGILALELVLLVAGVLRVGKLVDGEREAERERITLERAEERKEWLRREGVLTLERDEWRDRSVATDARLDRVAGAFERLAKAPAPE